MAEIAMLGIGVAVAGGLASLRQLPSHPVPGYQDAMQFDMSVHQRALKIQRERATKYHSVSQAQLSFEPDEEVPMIQREIDKGLEYLAMKFIEIERALTDARLKKRVANQTRAKEIVISREKSTQQAKLALEMKVLQDQAAKASHRSRDWHFVQDELKRLDKEILKEDKKQASILAEERKQSEEAMRAFTDKLDAQSVKDLQRAEALRSKLEETLAYNRKHPAPAWTLRVEMEEQDKETREIQQCKNIKDSANRLEARNMYAFVLDSKKDKVMNSCLGSKLEENCLPVGFAPTVSATEAVNYLGRKDDCLPHGLDEAIPEKQRGAVAAEWCNFVQLLSAVANYHGKRYSSFIVLQDEIALTSQDFGTRLVEFARKYDGAPWDLVQIDPYGTPAERDRDIGVKTLPSSVAVYRNSRAGAYSGMHALLVRTASAPRILNHMLSLPAVPLDSLPVLLNEHSDLCKAYPTACTRKPPIAVAFKAGIVKSAFEDKASGYPVARKAMCADQIKKGNTPPPTAATSASVRAVKAQLKLNFKSVPLSDGWSRAALDDGMQYWWRHNPDGDPEVVFDDPNDGRQTYNEDVSKIYMKKAHSVDPIQRTGEYHMILLGDFTGNLTVGDVLQAYSKGVLCGAIKIVQEHLDRTHPIDLVAIAERSGDNHVLGFSKDTPIDLALLSDGAEYMVTPNILPDTYSGDRALSYGTANITSRTLV